MSKVGESWGQLRRRWGAKLFDLSPEQRNRFIRDVIAVEDAFTTACLLDALRFRFDTPDCVFALLDELHEMQNCSDTTEHDYDAWAACARAALRQYIGETPKPERMLAN
jgi:hypothetical protein